MNSIEKLKNNLYLELNSWLSYCRLSWIDSGAPEGLNPEIVIDNPVLYDKYCYLYLERKYNLTIKFR